ncbi:MAG: hypothetical protein AAGA48_27205 [Myxococcota bacterium]
MKNLLTGDAPTDAEVQGILKDPSVLANYISQWQQTDAFRSKLTEFFRKSLQQQPADDNLGRQLHGNDNDNNIPNELETALENAFVRTAVRIATNDEPFTNIATTRTWELNTALMSWFLAVDRNPDQLEDYKFYTEPVTRNGIDFDANTPLGVQFENLTFHVAGLEAGCAQPFGFQDADDNIRGRRLLNLTVREMLDPTDELDDDECDLVVGLFNQGDYDDWRAVTMQPLGSDRPLDFFEVDTLRTSNTLSLRLPRTGFFMAPAFLAMWETNDDNSFRVTTNQALIAGLGIQFDSEDVTTPLGDDGLADAHAAPGTACYGCHKNLDPMRNYFKNDLTSPFYSVVDPDDLDDDYVYEEASFSFQGHSGSDAGGETLDDFGHHLAVHPEFAAGWTQKLCFFANSMKCDEDDPEFARVVKAFSASGYDFATLVRELFASPLVTRASCADGYERQFAPTSMARRDHLCAALSERLQIPGVCENRGSRARDLADSIPEDVWPRGRETPEQPTEPSLVYAATVDALCNAVSNNVVNRGESPITTSDVEGSLEFMVSNLMALPPSDPLHAPVLERLQAVISDAEKAGVNNARDRLRAAFQVACSSPFVTTVDL